MKKNIYVVLIVLFCLLICARVAWLQSAIIQADAEVKERLEFYKEESVRFGEIVAVFDNTLYVVDTLKERVIEVDVYEELVHCDIEIGDYAVYRVDYDYTDADLLNVIKKEDMEN